MKSARSTPALITDTVRAVIDSAKTSGVDRFVVVSAFGVGDSLAKASWLTAPLFRTLLRRIYADKVASTPSPFRTSRNYLTRQQLR